MYRVHVLRADITQLRCDAIVNAADVHLSGGGGVDLAIHRAAGPAMKEECRAIGHCPTGQAVMTKGYDLPCDAVLHTVGPIWKGGHQGEAQLLRSCYESCLALAREHSLKRLAFSAISCGAYRFPLDRAAQIALGAVAEAIRSDDEAFEEILFPCLHQKTLQAFSAALEEIRTTS